LEESSSGEPYLWLLFIAVNLFQPITFNIVTASVVTLLLLVCSAAVSGAEVAFFSMDPGNIQELKSSKSRKNDLVLRLIDQPKKLLATILITNNFVNVAIIILATYITTHLFNLEFYPVMAFVIEIVVVTLLILLFGEVIPKVYATQHAVQLAAFMALPIQFLDKVFRPVSYLLIRLTSIIDKQIEQKTPKISVDELSDALELTADEDLEEEQILKGIVKFGNTDVKQIMKPRLDITAVDQKTEYDELIKIILECGYSRIPVIKENPDNIAGILYIKDLLPSLDIGKNSTNTNANNWQSLIRPPFFVPENKKIDDLLKEFQEKKIHLAMVVDEYGGTSGLVTLEDIIEEIVGDISDEYDDDELVYSKLDNSNYVFEGKTPLNDLYRIMEIDGTAFEEKKGESDTLAGFVLELAGKILQKGETATFQNFVFTVEAADKRRVKRVKVTIEEKEESKE